MNRSFASDAEGRGGSQKTEGSADGEEVRRRFLRENVTYSSFRPSMRIREFRTKFQDLENGSRETHVSVSLSGRIIGKREAGKNLYFYDLLCENETVQILAEKKHFDGDADLFRSTNQNIRRGDIVGVQGFPGKSNRGELSLIPKQLRILAPCLHPLPTDRQPFVDPHLRFSQRYVDMLANATPLLAMKQRAKALNFIRQYLDERDFLEVETPILSFSSGGANAMPFRTRSAGLGGAELQMRIAPELFLKQMLVGGVERVYEIGKVFRNEGLSPVHAPEFTTCELYMAFANHEDLMRLTEDLLPSLVETVIGSTILRVPRSIAGHCVGIPPATPGSEDVVEIDVGAPFRRIDVMSELRDRFGDIPPASDEARFCECMIDILQRDECGGGIPESHPRTAGRLLDTLIGRTLEPECLSPTFLTGHPAVLSPLARSADSVDGDGDAATERFELFVGGKEIVNAYSELNDPVEQRKRFHQQAESRAAGDAEGMTADERFCTALEYGMPPAAGWGIGIDRLCMMMASVESIKEVQAFPLSGSGGGVVGNH